MCDKARDDMQQNKHNANGRRFGRKNDGLERGVTHNATIRPPRRIDHVWPGALASIETLARGALPIVATLAEYPSLSATPHALANDSASETPIERPADSDKTTRSTKRARNWRPLNNSPVGPATSPHTGDFGEGEGLHVARVRQRNRPECDIQAMLPEEGDGPHVTSARLRCAAHVLATRVEQTQGSNAAVGPFSAAP